MAGVVKANECFYDQKQDVQGDAQHAIELARRSAKVFRRYYEFNEETTVMMDFACGTGLVSRELIPYAKAIVGVDISQRMVDEYNRRVSNQGLTSDDMFAVRVDILDPDERTVPSELGNMRNQFDLVICASSYHHIHDIKRTTQVLAAYLKHGGTLLVIDLLKDDDIDIDKVFTEHTHTSTIVAHRGGFSEDEIHDAFQAAGLVSFEFSNAMKPKRRGHVVNLFIAKGIRKPQQN